MEDGIRTHDLRNHNPLLYPAELHPPFRPVGENSLPNRCANVIQIFVSAKHFAIFFTTNPFFAPTRKGAHPKTIANQPPIFRKKLLTSGLDCCIFAPHNGRTFALPTNNHPNILTQGDALATHRPQVQISLSASTAQPMVAPSCNVRPPHHAQNSATPSISAQNILPHLITNPKKHQNK